MMPGAQQPIERSDIVSLPVIGRVAAGEPILAEQNIVDEMPVPSRFIGNGNSFILTVHGDSMINIGINDGDYLIVQESREASNGEIVVAMVNDGYESGATVKRFFKEADHIRLQPENDHMDPIIAQDVTVVGKVKGVFRYFS
jgi:repressor LexA